MKFITCCYSIMAMAITMAFFPATNGWCQGDFIPVQIQSFSGNQIRWTNQSAFFSVQTIGTDPITCQWQRKPSVNADWVLIQTSSTNTVTLNQLSLGERCFIRCIATNGSGQSASSDTTDSEARLFVNAINTDLRDSVIRWIGQSATFTLAISGDSDASIQYQWRKNGRVISGNSNEIVQNNLQFSDSSATIYCIVSDRGVADTSIVCKLSVKQPVEIVENVPLTALAWEGKTLTLGIGVSGSWPVKFQWQSQSNTTGGWSDITGATGSSYTNPSVSAGLKYRCRVNNGLADIYSNECAVTVNIPAQFRSEITPLSKTVQVGDSTTFQITIRGTSVTYQWQHESSANSWEDLGTAATVNGEQMVQLQLTKIAARQHGRYRCHAYNDGADTFSTSAELVVQEKPIVIEIQPRDTAVLRTGNVIFKVRASGPDILYRWYANTKGRWDTVARATDSILSIRNTALTRGGSYRCQLTTEGGQSVLTNDVKLTVVDERQPEDKSAWTNQQLRLSASAQCYGSLMSYQWHHNGTAVPNATTNEYIDSLIQPEDSGSYFCRITNGSVSINTRTAIVQVFRSAQITLEPQSVTCWTKRPAQFTINAIGDEPLSYQWQCNTIDIPNENSKTLTIQSVAKENKGAYRCIVWNAGGRDTSAVAQLNIQITADITNKLPAAVEVFEDRQFRLSVTTDGDSITYRWENCKKNQTTWETITGAIDSIFTIDSVKMENDNTRYRCIVKNRGGEDTSDVCLLIAWDRARIVTDLPPLDSCWTGKLYTFSIQATGHNLHYVWTKKNTVIPTANGKDLVLQDITMADSGMYQCTVKNIGTGGWTVISRTARLIVKQTASITSITPRDTAVAEGARIVFSVSAFGEPSLAYQWFHQQDSIPGATDATYILGSVVKNNSGQYRCRVKNGGGETMSNAVTLSVLAPVAFIVNLRDTALYNGKKLTFKPVVTGDAPIVFQWFKNNVPITDTSTLLNNLTIDTLQFADSGSYCCKAFNAVSSAVSDSAKLIIFETASIVRHPASQQVDAGTAALFSIEGKGHQPLFYQWLKDGVAIPKQVDDTLIINAVSLNDQGNYRCIAGNGGGEDTSDIAGLLINTIGPAKVALNPISDTGWTGKPFMFTVFAVGTKPINYQWLKSGVSIPGETKDTLLFPAVSDSNQGNYSCIVSNTLGADTSDQAFLKVNKSVRIVVHPPDTISKPDGDSCVFSVIASGELPIQFQWFKDGFLISNATDSSFIIPRASSGDVGAYRCIVSNNRGANVDTSRACALRITNPTLSLIQPNGGEILIIGTQYTIKWINSGLIEYLKLEFSPGSGTKWYLQKDSIPNEKKEGEYNWTVPFGESHFCKIRISNSNGGFPNDESDDFFKKINITPITNEKNGKPEYNHSFFIGPNPARNNGTVRFSLIAGVECAEAQLFVFEPFGSLLWQDSHKQVLAKGKQIPIAAWNLEQFSRKRSSPLGCGAYRVVLKIRHSDGTYTILKEMLGIMK
ncbi:MAG: immunoglobulin domain-containing protein [Chitinivibrionales bacterium]|nr:immunoglobulin domain-containing protein [Chitinivibrionales bacterium]